MRIQRDLASGAIHVDSQSKAAFTIGNADDFDCLAMFARMRNRLPPPQHRQPTRARKPGTWCSCGILAQLLVGGTCGLVASFKAKTVLEVIRRNPPQILVGLPTMMMLLLMHPDSAATDLRSIRIVITSGSNVDSNLLTQLQRRMPGATIMNLYGLSEASGAIVMTPWECPDDDLMQSIGKPLEGAELRVVDATGDELPAGEIGELHFRGLGVVRDYIGAAASSKAFEGGWLRTGDLGLVDARGFISLKGRMKDMYIQGGLNVYPAEVEALIATHPAVVMVAGIGIAGIGVADKVLGEVVLRDALPLTPAGKIQEAALR